MSKTGHIISIRAGDGPGAYAPATGYNRLSGTLLETLNCEAWIGPRPALELMVPSQAQGEGGRVFPPFLQLIPYLLFRHDGLYMRYFRPDTGGEARLHGRISIGIGGHVDLFDAAINDDGSLDLVGTLDKAALREGVEETGVNLETPPDWIGLLYATTTAVDTVHLGIVGVIDLTDAQFASISANHEIADHRFDTLEAIAAEASDTKVIETWTNILIDASPIA